MPPLVAERAPEELPYRCGRRRVLHGALVRCVRVLLVALHRLQDGLVAGNTRDHDLALGEDALGVGLRRRSPAALLKDLSELARMPEVIRLEVAHPGADRRVLEPLDRGVIRADRVEIELD